jgi:hypothetical protein
MKLVFLPNSYSICQLSSDAAWPAWAAGQFLALIRTDEELTVVSRTDCVPEDVKAMHDHVCFRVEGDLAFDVVGVIAGIGKVLAEAEIPILSLSTYKTDYFLLANQRKDDAMLALRTAGYEVNG